MSHCLFKFPSYGSGPGFPREPGTSLHLTELDSGFLNFDFLGPVCRSVQLTLLVLNVRYLPTLITLLASKEDNKWFVLFTKRKGNDLKSSLYYCLNQR